VSEAVMGAIAISPARAEPDARQDRRKLDALTTLRFPAAAWAVLGHSLAQFSAFTPFWAGFALNQGVSFFFVLSGFILAYVYPTLESGGRARFLVSRVARIWPMHVVALLLAFCLLPGAILPSGSHTPFALLFDSSLLFYWPQIVTSLGIAPHWLTSLPIAPVNGPAWSLSVEFFFYLCFPLLLWSWRRAWPIMFAAVALGACGLMLFMDHRLHGKVGIRNLNYGSAVYDPLVRLFEFTLGMVSATLWRYLRPRISLSRLRGTLVELAVLVLTGVVMRNSDRWADWLTGTHYSNLTGSFTGQSPHGPFGSVTSYWLRSAGLVCLPFAALIFVMALEYGWVSRLLSVRPLVLLGEISYSVYLIHATIVALYATHSTYFAAVPHALHYSLYWLVVLLVSYVCWALVELPARHAIVSLWDRLAARRTGAIRSPRAAAPRASSVRSRGFAIARWQGAVVILVLLVSALSVPFTVAASPNIKLDRHIAADHDPVRVLDLPLALTSSDKADQVIHHKQLVDELLLPGPAQQVPLLMLPYILQARTDYPAAIATAIADQGDIFRAGDFPTVLRAHQIRYVVLHRDRIPNSARYAQLRDSLMRQLGGAFFDDRRAGLTAWQIPDSAAAADPASVGIALGTGWLPDLTLRGTRLERFTTQGAQILITAPSARLVTVRFVAETYLKAHTLAVRLNGKPLTQVSFDQIQTSSPVTLTKLPLQTGINVLQLDAVDGCTRPVDLDQQSRDTRCFAFGVQQLAVTENNAILPSLANLPLLSGQPLFAVDAIGASAAPSPQPPVVPQGSALTLGGWVVDPAAEQPASEVYLVVDGTQEVLASYGRDRLDVATFLHQPAYRSSGFTATVRTDTLSPGMHALTLRIVAADSGGYYFPAWRLDINVKPLSAFVRSAAATQADVTLTGPGVTTDSEGMVTVPSGANLAIAGWAIDQPAGTSAQAVLLSIDDRVDIPMTYPVLRPDVAATLGKPIYQLSGFSATVSDGFASHGILPGRHTLSLKVIAADGVSYYVPPWTKTLVLAG
jgi:peptidoglycan/LPS O-acetylase OafA/YrhL